MNFNAWGCWLLVAGFLVSTVHAAEPKKTDPFEETLREAVKEYRAGNMDKAQAAVAKATEILEKARSGAVVDTFPDAPAGWKAAEVEKAQIPDVFGGGRTVKRLYSEKEGKKEILLEVIYGSSLTKLFAGLVSNDAVAESQGFKIERVGTERALFKPSADGGELNVLIEEAVQLKLTGKGGVEKREMIALARDVDRRGLKDIK